MKVTNAISRIKAAGHDISDEYTTERCIEFLNSAIQQVSALLIAAQYPALIEETLVRDGDTLPQNFIKAAGTYPICITGNRAEMTDGDEAVVVRYWATPELIDEETEDLPYNHDAVNEVILKTAIMFALNENEYDISQDNTLMTTLQTAIASAMA